MKALRLEFIKARRKHLWIIMLAFVALEALWCFGPLSGEVSDPAQGYAALFYSLPALNAIMLPLLIAIVVSRTCDLEHSGGKLKELLTLQSSTGLFNAKFIYSAIIVLVAIILQSLFVVAFGSMSGYLDIPTIGDLALFSGSQFLVCLFLILLVQVVSLMLKNQFISLALGLALALLGLFALFFPPIVMRFVPSSYFSLLSNTAMNWDPATSVITYVRLDFPLGDCLLLIAACVILFLVSHFLFSTKEV